MKTNLNWTPRRTRRALLTTMCVVVLTGSMCLHGGTVSEAPRFKQIRIQSSDLWLFTGCPDDDATYVVLRDFVKEAELRDAIPAGAVAEKKRLDDAGVVTIMFIVPDTSSRSVAPLRDSLLHQAAACSETDVRCVLLIHTTGDHVDKWVVPSIPNVPQFVAASNLLRDGQGRQIDQDWPVRLSTPLTLVFDSMRRLRWFARLTADNVSGCELVTIGLTELHRGRENDCPRAGREKERATIRPKSQRPTKSEEPRPKSTQRETEEQRDGVLRLAHLKGVAYSLKTRQNVSLAARWLQQLERPVLMYVWATWCLPCRADWTPLQRLHASYGRETYFLGLAYEEDEPDVFSKVTSYLKTEAKYAPFATPQNTYIVLMPHPGQTTVLNRFGEDATTPPYFALFNREGEMVFALSGALDESTSKAALMCGLEAVKHPLKRDSTSAQCRCGTLYARPNLAWFADCGVDSRQTRNERR